MGKDIQLPGFQLEIKDYTIKHFPINFEPNEPPVGTKSIGKPFFARFGTKKRFVWFS